MLWSPAGAKLKQEGARCRGWRTMGGLDAGGAHQCSARRCVWEIAAVVTSRRPLDVGAARPLARAEVGAREPVCISALPNEARENNVPTVRCLTQTPAAAGTHWPNGGGTHASTHDTGQTVRLVLGLWTASILRLQNNWREV